MTQAERPTRFGIEALNVYCGLAYIPVRTLFEGRGLALDRLDNLMMDRRSVGLPFEDPVTNAVNAARPIIDRLGDEQRESIEMVITSSESGIDYSKSIASYVHEHLGLGRHCRLVEVKQACYAATAALQMAAGYLASGVSPGARVLIIATDVPLVDARAEYAEPATGTGGAALLVGERPEVMSLDLGAFGLYGYETMDSARPSPQFDIADVDRSLFTYLDCLSNSFDDYCGRVEGVDFVRTFDYLALHTPFAGLVKAAHRKMMREAEGAAPERVEEDFLRRVRPSLVYPGMVGNLCSGSVYLALGSVIDHASFDGSVRVGLYSYGSGCSAEFFSGVIDHRSVEAQARMSIGEHLERRFPLSFDEYEELLEENLRCLVPQESREVDPGRYAHLLRRARSDREILALRGIDGFHRDYTWIEPSNFGRDRGNERGEDLHHHEAPRARGDAGRRSAVDHHGLPAE